MQLVDSLAKLRASAPVPTNANAAALLWTYGTLPALSHSTKLARFRAPGGPIDRLVWLAAGYRKPGDKFAVETNTKHWTAPFPDPRTFWSVLLDMAKAHDAEHPTAPPPVYRGDIATGARGPLKAYLLLAWETLQAARAAGKEGKPPIGVPKLPKIPRPPGLPPEAPPVPKPEIPRLTPSRGSVLLLVLLAALLLSRRR